MDSEAVQYRREIKYVLDPGCYQDVLQAIRMHPAAFSVAYPDRQINNIYFDSYDYKLFQDSIVGLSNRAKLRYRWYGQSLDPVAGALEVKFRRNAMGSKLVYPVADLPYVCKQNWQTFTATLRKTLPFPAQRWLIDFPQPILINRYHRVYLVSADERIRITLDRNPVLLDQRHRATPNYSQKTPMPEGLIMEVKYDAGLDDVASGIVRHFPFCIGQHSKYTAALSVLSRG